MRRMAGLSSIVDASVIVDGYTGPVTHPRSVLSIVIQVYNEAEGLAALFKELNRVLDGRPKPAARGFPRIPRFSAAARQQA